MKGSYTITIQRYSEEKGVRGSERVRGVVIHYRGLVKG